MEGRRETKKKKKWRQDGEPVKMGFARGAGGNGFAE